MSLNAMTVDVEDWYMTNGLNVPRSAWHSCEDRIVPSTMRVLDLFERYSVKATFFVLGCVAEKHPSLVERIAAAGHEVGTHGQWHRMLTEMSVDEIVEDVMQSKRVLERITGKPVRMFRAPSWSITPETYRMLPLLEREGFVCDSSIQPSRTPLSGIAGAPEEPFHPVVDGRRLDLLEFPALVFGWGKWKIPFGGGFYLRALPYRFVRSALQQVNLRRPGMIYVHPWEFDPDQPRLRTSPLIRLAQYYRLEDTAPKVERLLQDFRFATVGEVLSANVFADMPLNVPAGGRMLEEPT